MGEGTTMLPKMVSSQASVQLRASELAVLLDGIALKSVKRMKRYQRDG